MKEQRRILRSCLFALGMLLSIQGMHAAVVWDGASTPTDVTDTDLILDASSGNITLGSNSTFINALTVDINVTLVNGNVTIQGDPGESILYLNPDSGRTITFDLTANPFDLTFLGATDGITRLLIVQDGAGDVAFLLPGGRTLTLTNDATHGPVEFYLVLQDLGTFLSFNRQDSTLLQKNSHIFINIGAGSLLSYASRDGLINTTTGSIEFSPMNTGSGRMAIAVSDTGAFTMAVHATEIIRGTDIVGVNRNFPAGGVATTRIFKSTPSDPSVDAALLILNYNAAYAEYLVDPYGNQGAATDLVDYAGSFDGLRYGVAAGANHILLIDDGAYLDYIGLANNSCPTPDSLPGIIDPTVPAELCPCDCGIPQFLKLRNYSALTIDGWLNPNALPSVIQLGSQSGIYFRSGVDADGNIVSDDLSDPHAFTINPDLLFTCGAGEYVFDVEAELQVIGSNVDTELVLNSRLEILSLEVAPFTGPLFPVEGTGTTFNGRTFATDVNGELYRYNKAAWLINDRAVFTATAIAHTDENHVVLQNNDVLSEPTYVGGEKWYLSLLRQDVPLVPRPLMGFQNGLFQIQTSVALTGVDLAIPTYLDANGVVLLNASDFKFYSNGYLVDDGTGRSMILGTLIGSQACDGCTIISDDAHLDIIQDADFLLGPQFPVQELTLTVSDNNALVNEDITTDITGQTSIHALYLGHNSNISIGTNADSTGFTNDTALVLIIAGNFFHFGTRGGSLGVPATSSVTGQGGIFVDLNAAFVILPQFIASIDAMVTKSHNAIIDLPVSQVFFSDQVGITDWQPNLAINPVIVPTGSEYSDYTLNWLTVTKDPDFVPYIIGDVNVCSCPAVTSANILNIPVVQGQVDQLQLVNSRIGDPAQILIAGGWVRELLWLSDCRAGEAPVAIVVLQDHGRLGLNNAHRNPDSLLTQTTLGVNGINIVANGSCRIDLNDDMIVNNVCAFLQGPDFAAGDVLEIRSDDPYTLYVTKEGVLDFSSFTVPGKVRFDGNIRVLFEPGATLVLGSSRVEPADRMVIEFGDQAIFEVSSAYELGLRITALDRFAGPTDNAVDPLVSVDYTLPNNQYSPLTGYGAGLSNTDPYRVRILGSGTLRFTDDSSASIRTNGILSVETFYQLSDGVFCSTSPTNVTLELTEAAQFNIGKGNNILGGVFQIGNVRPSEGPESINFTLTINGAAAIFGLGSGGFLGFGAGVARPNQGGNDNQSNVLADTLLAVNTITLNLFAGNLSANRIFNSDDFNSHSIVFGAMNRFNVNFATTDDMEQLNAADYLTSGGGNLFYMVASNQSNAGAMRLINRFDDNVINAPWPSILLPNRTVPLTRLFAGILASTELLAEATNLSDIAENIFLALKTGDSTLTFGPARGLADAAPLDPNRFRQERTFGLFGYVDRSMIGRQSFQDILDAEGGTPGERRNRIYDLGAARVQIDTNFAAPGSVVLASQIRS